MFIIKIKKQQSLDSLYSYLDCTKRERNNSQQNCDMALFQNSGRYKMKCVGSNTNFLNSYKNRDDDDNGGLLTFKDY